MSHASGPFESAVQKANIWLADVDDRLLSEDRHVAWEATRAVLHVLRDRLPLDAVLGLSAQTPLLIRGLLLEGWRPQDGPSNLHDAAMFGDAVADRLPSSFPFSGLEAADAVLGMLAARLDPGEVRKLLVHLPEPLRALWPTPGRPRASTDVPARRLRSPDRPRPRLSTGLAIGFGAALAVLGGLLLWAAWAGQFLSALVRAQPLPNEGLGLQGAMAGLVLVGVAVLTAAMVALTRRR